MAAKVATTELQEAAEYYEKVLELSPEDFDIQQHYAQCLVKLNIGKKQSIFL